MPVMDLSLPGKKGICYTLQDDNDHLRQTIKLEPYWNYSWTAPRYQQQPHDLEFIPMIWGGAKSLLDMRERIDQHIIPQIQQGSCQRLLCFNEPDKKEQSNMTVDRVLGFWPMLQELNVPLCSPACANPLACDKADDACQGVSGSWMKDFMQKVRQRNYRVDYVGVHWYGGPSPAAFQQRLRQIYKAYQRPLLITEFAVADWKAMHKTPSDNRHSPQQVLAFMKEVLPWMERQDWIAGYAWFPFSPTAAQGTSSALFDVHGKLTTLGQYYRSVRTNRPQGNQTIDDSTN